MKQTNPLRTRARRIGRELARLYPEARCALDFENPLQLLVATILAAQCTDARVNLVTPALFARFPDAAAFANADRKELERMIQSTGFFRSKARSLLACCRQLVEQHDGAVPRTMEELVQLPGVGRKTANVILGNCFDTPGIPVDTHVGRLSRRMGFTTHTDPVKVERDLMGLVPKKDWTRSTSVHADNANRPRDGWTMFAHRMILHGRQVCHARKPNCEGCTLAKLCPKIGVSAPEAGKQSVAKSLLLSRRKHAE
jgi:endonuclease-3